VTRVVILGGGFGGLEAARALAGAPVDVTVIDRQNYHLFQPLLYQVATASLSPGDIASPIRWILRHQKNVRVLLAEVTAVDVPNRVVRLDDGPGLKDVAYDFLIVTTGASHAYFGHTEWQDRAPGLKTLEDALEIRRRVLLAFEAAERVTDAALERRLLTFVIVGGGPTGVELAGALGEIARRTLRQDFRNIRPESARIVLLEGGPHLLGAFPEKLRDAARRSLTRLGVEVRTGAMVTSVDTDGVTWRDVSGSEERLPAQTVLWAAGVAASGVAVSLDAPLDRAGRVLAEPTLSVPGHAKIFVAGDICALQQDGKPLPGVAQVAMQQGRHAARNILRARAGQPLIPFRYRDYGNMATIGRGSAVADIRGLHVSGLPAWLLWLFVHITALIGFRNRIAVLVEWAWAYLTFQRRVRLITGGRKQSV
jgi:NADH:ubiquinone reductase (H+-translocating)